jgi:hypothetical protein
VWADNVTKIVPMRKDVALAEKISFGLMNLRSLPADEEERRLLRGLVEEDLDEFFMRDLSETDYLLWKGRNSETWSRETQIRIFSTFDRVICERAQDLGWRILESVQVRTRIQQWYEEHDRGVERLETLFKAIVLGSRRARGEAKSVPTDPAWQIAKKKAIPELRLVIRRHQTEFRQRRRTPSHDENWKWFQETVTKSAASFPFLAQNLRGLIMFLAYVKDNDQVFARRLLLSEVKAAEFFNVWGAWGLNVSPETFRQALTKL